MQGPFRRLWLGMFLVAALMESGFGQQALTWQEVRTKFEAATPTLQAGQIGINESRAQEITAYLRPNPTAWLLADQIDPSMVARGMAHLPISYPWQALATCTNASTSGNCAWRVRRDTKEAIEKIRLLAPSGERVSLA